MRRRWPSPAGGQAESAGKLGDLLLALHGIFLHAGSLDPARVAERFITDPGSLRVARHQLHKLRRRWPWLESLAEPEDLSGDAVLGVLAEFAKKPTLGFRAERCVLPAQFCRWVSTIWRRALVKAVLVHLRQRHHEARPFGITRAGKTLLTLDDRLCRIELDDLLAQLSPPLRECVSLRLEGYCLREIAARVGVCTEAVWYRLRRARDLLASHWPLELDRMLP